jgi:NAD+ synthase
METQVKTLNYTEVKNQISEWLKSYATKANQKGYVIGVSGGIDSAVCSTLCALTGLPLIVVRMSIHQAADQADRGARHIQWLKENFPNVSEIDVDLTSVYDAQLEALTNSKVFANAETQDDVFFVGANMRSRLRMITLYGIGNLNKLLVCGTGNKVEDYGVGFFTKFGDGGVDVSPIGELMKSEVYALGKELGVIQDILDARPTDGLWDDGRTDEDQIGATYDELEWAMNFCDKHSTAENETMQYPDMLSARQTQVVKIYWKRHTVNQHKMIMPPICEISNLRN